MKATHNCPKGKIFQTKNLSLSTSVFQNEGIWFWTQNQLDIEHLCVCCGKGLRTPHQRLRDLVEDQWYCSTECNELHFIRQGGWLWRNNDPSYCHSKTAHKPGTGVFDKMREMLDEKRLDLFFTTTKLLGYILSSVISSCAVSGEDCEQESYLHFGAAFNHFFQPFEHSSLLSLTTKYFTSYNESLVETHSLLLAVLMFEKFPPFQQLLRQPAGASFECIRKSYLRIIKEIFTLPLWIRLLQIVDYFSVTFYVESDFLGRAKELPLLTTYDLRKNSFEKEFEKFSLPSTQFLLQSMCEENHEIIQNCTEEESIEFDRKLVRIAQAAELANKPNINVGQKNSSVQCKFSNPFDGYGHVITILSPLFVPREGDDDETSATRLSQSCLPSICLDLVLCSDPNHLNDKFSMQLQLVANQNILVGDEISYNFSKAEIEDEENRTTIGNHNIHLGAHSRLFEFRDDRKISCFCNCVKCALERDTLPTLRLLGVSEDIVMKLTCSYPKENSGDGIGKKRKLSQLFKSHSNQVDQDNMSCLEKLSSLLTVRNALDNLFSQATEKISLASTKYLHSNPDTSKLRKLRDVADYYMQQQRVAIGTILYITLLLQLLQSPVSVDSSSSPHTNDSWIGDVCVSLGSIGFETLLSTHLQSVDLMWQQHKEPMWTCERLKTIYELGLLFSPYHKILEDVVHKLRQFSPLFSQTTLMDTPATSLPSPNTFKCLLKEKIFGSDRPVLSQDECEKLIQAAENCAAQADGGWSTSRHYTVPTTDIPLHHLPISISGWFVEEIMTNRLWPLLKSQFFSDPKVKSISILMNDCFIVKYSADCSHPAKLAQRYLPLHSDQSTHSLTIALNNKEDYVGGGTFFTDLNCAVRVDQGCVTSFRGDLLHGGDPIIFGTRYIIALFMVIVPVFHEEIEERESEIDEVSNNSQSDQTSSFSFNFFGE